MSKKKNLPGYKGEAPDTRYISDNSAKANKKMLEELEKKQKKTAKK